MSVNKTRAKNKHEESKLQKACVLWFRMQYRDKRRLLFSIPNGAMLNGNQNQRLIAGKRMKDEGLVPGVSDLFLSIPSGEYNGLYLEAKTQKGRQSDSQKEFEQDVTSEGYGYALFRSITEFQNIVKSYLESGIY